MILIDYLLIFFVSWSTLALKSVSQNICSPETAGVCVVDNFVGTYIIYEDDLVRIWNFTLAPGEMTSMHKHMCDYHFVAIQPTELEVYSESGARLFSFQAQGSLGFRIVDDDLVQNRPIGSNEDFVPIRAPRVHAARNIGSAIYNEILYERKSNCLI